jgi:hypothetical protein
VSGRDPWWKRMWTSQVVIVAYGLGAMIVGYFLGATNGCFS